MNGEREMTTGVSAPMDFRYLRLVIPIFRTKKNKDGREVVFISGCRHDTLSRRRVGDSNPRYSNPVRQFSKPVYGKNFCKNIFTLYSVQ